MGTAYSITYPKHKIIIYEMGDSHYELRVDNLVFKVDLNSPQSSNTLFAPQDVHIRNKSSGNSGLKQESQDYPIKGSKDIKKIKLRESSPNPLPSPEKKIEKKPEIPVEKLAQPIPKKVKQEEIFNIFDVSDTSGNTSGNTIPLDLFSAPLSVSSDNQAGFNPFEEKTSSQGPSIIVSQSVNKIEETKKKDDFFNLVDLDGLHLGDNYSPAFAKKIEEANKPVTISNSNVPNVPMQNLVAQREMNTQPMPNMMNPMAGMMNPNMMSQNMMNPNMMNPNMMNPNMMNMMNMNPFMTNMMMGQFNGFYQNPNNNN